MFLVLNKEKMCAYVVSVLTVCFLFFIANTTENIVETSSNTNTANYIDQNNTNTVNYINQNNTNLE